MGAFKDFIDGLLKPVFDMLSSIIFYSVIQLFLNHDSIFTFNIWAFLFLWGLISTLEDMIKGFYKGFEAPKNAGYYLFGIVTGIGIFWGFLNAASIIVGGTMGDVIFSGAVIMIVIIVGIILRSYISIRRRRVG